MGQNSGPPPGYYSDPHSFQSMIAATQGNQDVLKSMGATDPTLKAAADWNAQHQGGNGKAAPPPPDYSQQAITAAGISRQNVARQTQENRPDVSTPFANQNWTVGPDGRPVLNTGFSGPLANAASSAGSELASNLSSPMDTGTQARNQAIDAAYGASTSRLNPRLAQARELMDSRLANQGLDPRSPAARADADEFGRQENDAYQQAMNAAIGQGTQAQQVTFNENLAQRYAPLTALQGLQGLTGTPNFNAAGVAETPQLLPAAIAKGNYDLQNQQMQDQIFGDIASAAGNVLTAPFQFIKK